MEFNEDIDLQLNLTVDSIFEQNNGNNADDVDNIFSYFIMTASEKKAPGGKERGKMKLAYMTWFAIHFPATEFEKENRLFWHFIGYAASIGVNVTEKLLEVYIQTELKEFLLKNKLHVKGTSKLRYEEASQVDNIVRITANRLVDEFYRLSSIDHEDLEEFIIDIKHWMHMNKTKRFEEIMTSGFTMMDDIKKGKVGTDDSLDYVLAKGNEIKMMYDEENLEDLIETDEILDTDIKFITDSGIPAIDNDSGGIYETQMFGLEAAGGEGKSRFIRGTYGYRASTLYNQNVLDFGLEQDKSEYEAMYVARHIYAEHEVLITDKMILTKKDLHGNPISEEARQIIEVARYDLFKSGKYGKIHIVADMLYLETFIERMRMLDMRHGPFKLIMIDYLTLIEQENSDKFNKLQEHQVYKFAYKWFKRYLRKTRKAGIAVNQLTAEESDKVSSGKGAGKSGGSGTLESRKTPDRVDVLSSTEIMRRKHARRLTPVKTRSSEGVVAPVLNTKLGQCYFEQATKSDEYKE